MFGGCGCGLFNGDGFWGMGILERYARGEIDFEEYQKRKKELLR